MEKVLKAYQHLRSGIYFLESLPLLGANIIFKKAKDRYQVTAKDLEHVTKKVDELFQFDAECIAEGVYPISVLTPKSPFQHLTTLRKIYFDTLRVFYRKLFNQTKSFSAEAKKVMDQLPDYYKRNFHFQTDGYLSDESAEIYNHQVELLFKGTSFAMRRLFLKDMKKYLSQKKDDLHILEVAIGPGTATEFIAKTFPDAKITCLDLSPLYLKKAQANLKKFSNINFIQGAAENLPFNDNTYDAVVSVYLYHEIPREVRKQVIAESLRVLKPDGYLGVVDSIQRDDDSELNWAIEEFPKDFHEPFYKDYIENPMENLVSPNETVLINKRVGFFTKALSYKKT